MAISGQLHPVTQQTNKQMQQLSYDGAYLRSKTSLFLKVHAPECYRNHEGYQAELQDFWKRQDIEMLTESGKQWFFW